MTNQNKDLAQSHPEGERTQIELMAGMAGSIAHDFSNWVGIIAGHASSIAENLIPNTRAHREAMAILEATKHAGGLTKRLLSFARSAKGSGEQLIEDVPLQEVVEDAIAIARETFAGGEIRFHFRNRRKTDLVRIDAGQFLEVLLNLFRNAVDAMPDGGSITIDASLRHVEEREYVVLRVRDTGVGIPPDVRKRMFEPFFSTKGDGASLGLGLTVVQNVVESWGGTLKVRSTPGHGASFRVFLPKAKTRKGARPGTREHEIETVLIVDDDEECLARIEEIFSEAGYRTLTAKNGEDALELFRANTGRINLAVIDLVMPGTDGKQVVAQILDTDPTAQIIMTSGFSRDYVRGYLEVGAWGFAQKPVDPERLLSTARRILGQSPAATSPRTG